MDRGLQRCCDMACSSILADAFSASFPMKTQRKLALPPKKPAFIFALELHVGDGQYHELQAARPVAPNPAQYLHESIHVGSS